MKKKIHLLLTLPIVIVLGIGVFFLLLPSLLNLYLFPRLMAELPFTEKKVSLYRVTPWKTSGTISLANANQPALSVPRFELDYTPGSLIRGKISGLLLDSISVHIETLGGQLLLRGLPANDAPALEKNSSEDTPLAALLPLSIENISLKNSTVTLHQEQQEPSKIVVDGHFNLGFLEQPDNRKLLTTLTAQIVTKGDLALSGEIGLNSIGADYEAKATLSSLQFRQNDFFLAAAAADQPITLQLTGNLKKARFALANIVLTHPEKARLGMDGEIEPTEGTFHGRSHIFLERTKSAFSINFNGDTHHSRTSINYTLEGQPFTIADAFSFSPFELEGNLALDGAALAGQLRGKFPEITLKNSRTKLVNLSLQMPLQYPFPETGAAGALKIEQIRYQNSNSGTLQAKISQSPEGILASTLLTTPFLPGLQLVCDGSALLSGNISAHCRIPETKIDSTTFPSFIAFPDKLSLTGRLAAEGDFYLTDKQPAGKITIKYHNGTLVQGKNKLSDINATVVFPRLPLLQTAPGQLCTIGAIEYGTIKLSDGQVLFRIEDAQSIFLEKIRLNWCGGKVETGSFTLAKNMKKLETTLYCDRLGFTELLAQFGIDKAEGQGSLNGRLPMVISRQGLMFDDGFLFSTPGNSGIVRFNDTRQLRQGIPDINKSSYLDYSMKALENFSYNWTKLSFNSRNDELLITMQLDGEPAEPLPFGYKNGQLVPSRKGPGVQHPIRLDVNFRLPMNDLFHYGTSIQSMMEKM